jgi:hypothetical protein
LDVEELERVAESGPPDEVWPTLRDVLPFLASPDPRLRDELAFQILSDWVYERDLLTPAELREMLALALSDQGLRRGLGEAGTDSVFGRSFSALVVALVVDNRRPYLSSVELEQVFTALLDYAQSERDLRGFVEGKGWAHAAAHVADGIGECLLSRHATPETARSATEALCSLVTRAEEVFGAEEDERIAVALAGAVEQGKLSIAELATYVAAVAPTTDRVKRLNRKLLARSLYFQLARPEELLPLVAWDIGDVSEESQP